MENLTVLPYLRIYFRVLNAIEKSCFETLHTTSCVTRTALDRLCPEVGRSSTLLRNLLLFIVTRLYCCRGCLSKKGPSHTTCNPTRMLCYKHVNEMLCFLWITLTANSQKFVPFLTQASHAIGISRNSDKFLRNVDEKKMISVE